VNTISHKKAQKAHKGLLKDDPLFNFTFR